MCVNLKTFNESFRKWAEENQEDEEGYAYTWSRPDEQEPEEATNTHEEEKEQ